MSERVLVEVEAERHAHRKDVEYLLGRVEKAEAELARLRAVEDAAREVLDAIDTAAAGPKFSCPLRLLRSALSTDG